jgi:hypothetical protein
VLAANDQIIVCDDMITQAFYIFEIALTKDTRAGQGPAPNPGAITRPKPPFKDRASAPLPKPPPALLFKTTFSHL